MPRARGTGSRRRRRSVLRGAAWAVALAACGSPGGPRVTVTVPPGASLDAAIDSLAAQHVIGQARLFRVYARLRGLGGALKSGVYLLRQDESWGDVVAALERGRGVERRFTVREGLRLSEVAELAHSTLAIARDSFVAAAEDSALLAGLSLPRGATSAEGYLFPTTYLLPLHIDAPELVQVMTHQFVEQWSPEWQARLDSLGLSRHQLVTLASIVEAEARYDPDRPFIALPPGPIGQPGRASLVAALYPADVPFLYFVAQPDGKHIFSATFAEHEAAIARVKQLRRAARAPPRRDR